MPRLSVILITLNEERNLRRCLESVSFADEIVLNDTGSTDRTLEIAREFNCRILEMPFPGFGIAKQKALEAATGDWVLSIDADEELDEELQRAVQAAVAGEEHAGYEIVRKSQFLGHWIMHSGWYPDKILRLFRRERARFTDARVHERVVVKGSIGVLAGHMLHYTYSDITQYLKKMDQYSTLSALTLHNDGRRFATSQLLVKPPAYFVKMYLLKSGWRDGLPGLILALLSSFHELVKFAKLWEVERR